MSKKGFPVTLYVDEEGSSTIVNSNEGFYTSAEDYLDKTDDADGAEVKLAEYKFVGLKKFKISVAMVEVKK